MLVSEIVTGIFSISRLLNDHDERWVPMELGATLLSFLFLCVFLYGFRQVPKKDSSRLLRKAVVVVMVAFGMSTLYSFYVFTSPSTDALEQDSLSAIILCAVGAVSFLSLGAALLKTPRLGKLTVSTGVTSIIAGVSYLSYLLGIIGAALGLIVYVMLIVLLFKTANRYAKAP